MKAVLLARHGQSVSNAIRRFQGVQDVPLSELGLRQAQALSAAVSGRRLAHVYASPLQRARRTAEIAMAGRDVPLSVVDDLRELSLGDWEGRAIEEIRALPGDPYAQWVRDPVAFTPPGAEPLETVQSRVLRALAEIAAAHPNGDDVLVVAHGGVISVYACHVLGCSFNTLWRLRIDNGSLTVVEPPALVTLNDTAHLDSRTRSGHAP